MSAALGRPKQARFRLAGVRPDTACPEGIPRLANAWPIRGQASAQREGCTNE